MSFRSSVLHAGHWRATANALNCVCDAMFGIAGFCAMEDVEGVHVRLDVFWRRVFQSGDLCVLAAAW